jgi:hypothetical protein
MAFVPTKGTLLQVAIASVMTTIAQCIGIDGLGGELQVVEIKTLDQAAAGIRKKSSGYVNYSDITFDLYWDPVLSTHQLLTDRLTEPLPPDEDDDFQIVAADEAQTEYQFSGGVKSVSIAVDSGDYLKASCALFVDGEVAWPT